MIVNNYFEKDVVKIFRPMMLQNFLFPFLKNTDDDDLCIFYLKLEIV